MGRGMFEGFEGYRSVTPEQQRDAVKHSMVVLDTNVLLHLYNYQGEVLDDFMELFAALGDRLFVPHQAMDEFWRNRIRVLKENKGKHQEAEAIEKAFDTIAGEFERWFHRAVSRNGDVDARVLQEIEEAREAVSAFMEEQEATGKVSADTPTQDDPVVRRLETILEGKVGAVPLPAERSAMLKIGKQRIADKVPPGYMDGEKNPERAVGDFIVWQQVMDEAASRQVPVLLVTNDNKEDWWADRGSAAQRARPELVSELLEVAGQSLIMMRSLDLLRLASVLGVDVNVETLAAVEEGSRPSNWTDEMRWDYLQLLYSRWPKHLEVFVEALENGGQISREDLGARLRRNTETNMRGVGRPFATALRHVCADYDLDAEGFDLPLGAHYDDTNWMDYFEVPSEDLDGFLAVAREFMAADEEDGETSSIE